MGQEAQEKEKILALSEVELKVQMQNRAKLRWKTQLLFSDIFISQNIYKKLKHGEAINTKCIRN